MAPETTVTPAYRLGDFGDFYEPDFTTLMPEVNLVGNEEADQKMAEAEEADIKLTSDVQSEQKMDEVKETQSDQKKPEVEETDVKPATDVQADQKKAEVEIMHQVTTPAPDIQPANEEESDQEEGEKAEEEEGEEAESATSNPIDKVTSEDEANKDQPENEGEDEYSSEEYEEEEGGEDYASGEEVEGEGAVPLVQAQNTTANANQPAEGYAGQQRSKQQPIILSVSQPRNPFQIYSSYYNYI